MKSIYITDTIDGRIKKWCRATGHGTNSIIEAALNALDSMAEFETKKSIEKTELGRVDLRGEEPLE